MFTENKVFVKKANEYKRPLKHTKVFPKKIVKIIEDKVAFQQLNMEECSDFDTPLVIGCGDCVILDFGRHCVGYLHYELNHFENAITDSPVVLKFTFGEFPYELEAEPTQYQGELGSGWLQNETRNIVFTPYRGELERRYSFRYLKIERIDVPKSLDGAVSSPDIALTEIFADCVSAVNFEDARRFDIPDLRLKKIYDMSVMTLAECSQDVYEDGPKRDRRLWIGDLRLEALTDYVVFNNTDLIKRCIYLFASYRAPHKFVAPCLFPDSPPYVDDWYFQDYALFFISCIYDYTINTGNMDLTEEFYEQMKEQLSLTEIAFKQGNMAEKSHIDWCEGLDKQVAVLGVYIYAFKQFKKLAELMNKETSDIEKQIELLSQELMKYYSSEAKLFVTEGGQISIHSQIWAVLSGVMEIEKCKELLNKIKNYNFEYYIHTPYMMHYYIEALYNCGLKDEAMGLIIKFWGEIADFGFDCCPEIFNPENHFESPYSAPEINSACHAWSCTPAYWIYKYYNETTLSK